MNKIPETKIDQWDMSPEEYVTLLYRTILRREPDDEGLIAHTKALRQHGDPTKIANTIISSVEHRVGRVENQLNILDPKIKFTGNSRNKPSLENDLSFVLAASESHFSDINFFKRLPRFNSEKKSQPTRFGPVKNVALYYWRLNNGGTERVTARQAQMWTKLGYNVTLITDEEPDVINDYEYDAANVKRFVIPQRMMNNQFYPNRGRALADVLKLEDIDVFVTNQWYEISTIWDILVAKSLGITTIVGWHNAFDAGIHGVDDLRLAHLRYLGYRHADLVACLSSVDQIWFDAWDIPTRMVHNPLTLDALPEDFATPDGNTLVWIARAEKHQKRIDHVLKMFPLVLNQVPDATLLIVGGGPDLEWAREYANALGVSGRVHFVGYTTEVDKYIKRAAVHVMTSEFEGYPMVLGEVWSHGVPTVMYDLPHLEYLRSGKGHVVVEQSDVLGLAAAIVTLLKDSRRRKSMGEEARAVVENIQKQNVDDAWKDIFDKAGNGKLERVQATHVDQLQSTQILVKMLASKLLGLNQANDAPDPALYMPSSATIEPPKTKLMRRMVKAARIVGAPYQFARVTARNYLAPDLRLKMIDLSDVGLGDNIMIWTGLYALLDNDVPVCAPGCVIHVQPILAELCSRLFARFGLVVQRGKPEKEISPLYSPLPPHTLRQWWGTYVGRDWRMNWVEAIDQQKTFPRHGADRSFRASIRLRVSERLLYGRDSWTKATPSYVGYRVWLPIAQKHGVLPIIFLSQMKRALLSMRQIVSDFVDEITPDTDREPYRRNAAFPAGKSFQTIPPLVFSTINKAMGDDAFTCFVQEDSAWHDDYQKNNIAIESLKNLRETFKVIKYARNLITTDSFTSHIAQLLRDDFTLVLSRDMQESIVHPGSYPRIVSNHPPCAPCNYQERYHYKTCVAGYSYCAAFESQEFSARIIASIQPANTR